MTLFFLFSCGANETPYEKGNGNRTLSMDNNRASPGRTGDIDKHIIATGNKSVTLKDIVTGPWSDGTLESANFDIQEDSIYYVDQGAAYRYSLNGDMLTIHYPEYSYKAKLTVQGDTLVMDSEEYGQSRFWRFKN